jgi:serine/threonine protein kinase
MIGSTLGRYRLDSLLGQGGMGTVYRASDSTLGRMAAVKLLPADVSRDAQRLERFTREARTASALSHPNIVTIYEVGAEDGQHFIAMELVDGETLRERLGRGRLELARALDWLAQISDGVAAAHAAGIVHRDLKPENIVIAKNGFAKILDFGLAKLRAAPEATDDGATLARSTTPGVILGTVGYMAPEQARGEEVDSRADIFALGCILYEAVAGARAFRGESSVDTLHKIIYSEPAPLSEMAPETPAEVQRIVRKCLSKDPDQRYQSAKDVAIDLREARRELESQSGARVSSAHPPRPSRRVPIAAILVLLAAVAAATAWWGFGRKQAAPLAATVQQPMSITRLTDSGNTIGAAISPDGEYLAYVHSEAVRHSLWLRQIATNSVLQIVPPSQSGYWGLTFAPDSRSVYYALKSDEEPAGALYQVPILGGPSRRVLRRIDSHVHFSPDGTEMVFIRNHEPREGDSAVVIARADGTNERVLLSRSPPQGVRLFWGAPDWSPDGKSIAVPIRSDGMFRLFVADVATGRAQPLSRDEWAILGDVRWLSDGSGMIVAGGDSPTRTQLWFVSRDGTRRPVTNDLYAYRIACTTRDDGRLVSVASDWSSSVWRIAIDGSRPPERVTTGKYDGGRSLAVAADRTVFFNTSDTTEIWSVDAGGERRQVAGGKGAGAQAVAVSPDQQYLVTTVVRENRWELARVNRDGTGLKVLCPIANTRNARAAIQVTPDSKSVFFDSTIDGVARIWRIPIDGGTPVRVVDGDSPAVSPDGSKLAFLRESSVVVTSIDGGPPIHTFAAMGVTSSSMVRWSRDGKGLFHNAAANDRRNVWYLPLDGSEGRPVTRFDSEMVHTLDVSPDGAELVVGRGDLSRDAVLIRNFR